MAALGERVVIGIVQIMGAERPVTLAGAALVSQEEVSGDGVGVVPCVRHVFAGAPDDIVLDSRFGQMGKGGVGSAFQNGESVRVGDEFVGIDQAANEFVVAVGGEAILFVEIAGDGLSGDTSEARDFVATVQCS